MSIHQYYDSNKKIKDRERNFMVKEIYMYNEKVKSY